MKCVFRKKITIKYEGNSYSRVEDLEDHYKDLVEHGDMTEEEVAKYFRDGTFDPSDTSTLARGMYELMIQSDECPPFLYNAPFSGEGVTVIIETIQQDNKR